MSLTKSEVTAVIITVVFVIAAAVSMFFGVAAQSELCVAVKSISEQEKTLPEEAAQADKININTADEDTLCSLPGIGKALASSICAYRAEHGGFASINEICRVSGIGEDTFRQIEALITV